MLRVVQGLKRLHKQVCMRQWTRQHEGIVRKIRCGNNIKKFGLPYACIGAWNELEVVVQARNIHDFRLSWLNAELMTGQHDPSCLLLVGECTNMHLVFGKFVDNVRRNCRLL